MRITLDSSAYTSSVYVVELNSGAEMRVSISHETIKKGWIFPTEFFAVKVVVHLTEEEKQIIKENDIADTVVIPALESASKRSNQPQPYPWTSAQWVNFLRSDPTFVRDFRTKSTAKKFEEHAKICLVEAKEDLDDLADDNEGTTFEI